VESPKQRRGVRGTDAESKHTHPANSPAIQAHPHAPPQQYSTAPRIAASK